MKFDIEKFGLDIYIARRTKGRLNLTEASKKIGISKTSLNDIEGGHVPSMDVFCKVMAWLETEPEIYFEK